jgi:hypothetical protein
MAGLGQADGMGKDMLGAGCRAAGAGAGVLKKLPRSKGRTLECSELKFELILTMVHTVCMFVKWKEGQASGFPKKSTLSTRSGMWWA